MKETLNTAGSLLGDLSGFKGFKREATELAEELQSYCKDQFESWVSEMMTAIDDPKRPIRYCKILKFTSSEKSRFRACSVD